MGGKIAMDLAQQHPNRIEKLAVLDIAPFAYTQIIMTKFSKH